MSEWMLSENHPKAFRMFPTSITVCEHGANFLPCIVQFDWFISEQLRYSLNIYSSFEKRCRRKMCSWQGNMGYHQYNLRSALFSFRFENYISAGKAKRKESLIQTFYETSAAHFFDWLAFAESANQNYFRCLFF